MSICAHLWRCWESQVCIKLLNKLWGVPCCQHSQKILAALWRFLMDLQVWISVLCSSTLLAFMQLRLQYFLYNQQIKSSLELQKAVGFKHSIYCYETVVVVIITFRILISYSTRYHCVMIVYLKILWHGIPPHILASYLDKYVTLLLLSVVWFTDNSLQAWLRPKLLTYLEMSDNFIAFILRPTWSCLVSLVMLRAPMKLCITSWEPFGLCQTSSSKDNMAAK